MRNNDATVSRFNGQPRSHIGAGAVSAEPDGHLQSDGPVQYGAAILERSGKRVLRREAVVDGGDSRLQSVGEPSGDGFRTFDISKNESSAVEPDEDGSILLRILASVDPHRCPA